MVRIREAPLQGWEQTVWSQHRTPRGLTHVEALLCAIPRLHSIECHAMTAYLRLSPCTASDAGHNTWHRKCHRAIECRVDFRSRYKGGAAKGFPLFCDAPHHLLRRPPSGGWVSWMSYLQMTWMATLCWRRVHVGKNVLKV